MLWRLRPLQQRVSPGVHLSWNLCVGWKVNFGYTAEQQGWHFCCFLKVALYRSTVCPLFCGVVSRAARGGPSCASVWRTFMCQCPLYCEHCLSRIQILAREEPSCAQANVSFLWTLIMIYGVSVICRNAQRLMWHLWIIQDIHFRSCILVFCQCIDSAMVSYNFYMYHHKSLKKMKSSATPLTFLHLVNIHTDTLQSGFTSFLVWRLSQRLHSTTRSVALMMCTSQRSLSFSTVLWWVQPVAHWATLLEHSPVTLSVLFCPVPDWPLSARPQYSICSLWSPPGRPLYSSVQKSVLNL